jgi:hypothetical protein
MRKVRWNVEPTFHEIPARPIKHVVEYSRFGADCYSCKEPINPNELCIVKMTSVPRQFHVNHFKYKDFEVNDFYGYENLKKVDQRIIASELKKFITTKPETH